MPEFFDSAIPVRMRTRDVRLQRQRRALHYIFAFIGLSIHDVVNDPVARIRVRGYFKLYRQIERRCEITELERQWNSLGG